MRIATLIIVFFLVLSWTSCGKDNNNIPLVAVDLTIDINLPQFFDLGVPTGWVYVTGGSLGILIYRRTESEFNAYDRHSTYQVDEFCQVQVSDDNVIIDDECSDSQWVITDGSVVQGPASAPLKQYNTQFNGSILRVFN